MFSLITNRFSLLQNYFRDTWNIFDFITVLGSITEIIVDLQVRHCQDNIHFHNVAAPKDDSNSQLWMRLPFSPSFPVCYDPCFQTQLKSCCDEFRHLCCASCLSLSLFCVTLSPTVCASDPVGEHHQHELPEAFPNGQVDQAAATGLHHPYSAVDLCTVLQGGLIHNLWLLWITRGNKWLLHDHLSALPQALPYVCLLIAMLFFIYAIIGMQVSGLLTFNSLNKAVSFKCSFSHTWYVYRAEGPAKKCYTIDLFACLQSSHAGAQNRTD